MHGYVLYDFFLEIIIMHIKRKTKLVYYIYIPSTSGKWKGKFRRPPQFLVLVFVSWYGCFIDCIFNLHRLCSWKLDREINRDIKERERWETVRLKKRENSIMYSRREKREKGCGDLSAVTAAADHSIRNWLPHLTIGQKVYKIYVYYM